MAGFKLPKPKAAKGAAKLNRMGRALSKQAPTNIFSKTKARKKTRLPGGKRPK
jgi:hypothetical protein